MNHNIQDLKEAIQKHQVILFVGAGVSRNLGVPDYGQLMDAVAKELGLDLQAGEKTYDYMQLAEYYKLERKSLGELRSDLDKSMNTLATGTISDSEIHMKIVDLHFPIIYTTNYDNWLEEAYKAKRVPYTKIVNVSDFVNIEDGKPQIVKFHGDFTDDSSIVLTESSYLERMEFSNPLDVKLLSDVLGKTLLFIGYSMKDVDTRLLLYKIQKVWREYRDIRPPSYIFLTEHNVVKERLLKCRGVNPIVSESADPGEGLLHFLTQLAE